MQGEPYPPQRLTIEIGRTQVVSGLLLAPGQSTACLVLAHGAGAGMSHPFMIAAAAGLYERGVATLRYQFPYMERGARRPDPPTVAHQAVHAAVEAANRYLPRLALLAGGKSFGGRMTSQAQAASPLPGVRGLVFMGFPLHPAGAPSQSRAQHLRDVQVPMLFLQGDRDTLALPDLMQQVTKELGGRATLAMFAGADHSFHVPARSGRTDQQVRDALLDALADWVHRVIDG